MGCVRVARVGEELRGWDQLGWQDAAVDRGCVRVVCGYKSATRCSDDEGGAQATKVKASSSVRERRDSNIKISLIMNLHNKQI